MLSFSLVCLFCLFTPFLSVLFILRRKNLVLLNLINRYMTKRKDIVEIEFLVLVNYSFKFNADGCCEHISSGVNIYLYGSVSLLIPECTGCVCVCDIKSEYQEKTPLCQTSVNLMPYCINHTVSSFWN